MTKKIMSDLNLGLERNCDADYDCVVVLKAVLGEALKTMSESERNRLCGSAIYKKAIKGISQMKAANTGKV